MDYIKENRDECIRFTPEDICDVDWGKYVSALTDIGYNSYACIEVEDKAFEDTRERILDSVALSCRYMRQFVI